MTVQVLEILRRLDVIRVANLAGHGQMNCLASVTWSCTPGSVLPDTSVVKYVDRFVPRLISALASAVRW